jgi:hypothetical protein
MLIALALGFILMAMIALISEALKQQTQAKEPKNPIFFKGKNFSLTLKNLFFFLASQMIEVNCKTNFSSFSFCVSQIRSGRINPSINVKWQTFWRKIITFQNICRAQRWWDDLKRL